ncbi:MAG: drug exporter of the superfamily [Nocardia sp.]|uniref:MMPL family transporter n=1 Tax=Nocardia sp. TaxID=1821 RepID=UPI0026316201|nr:MMPL family transporter [Nocardia sp.]MCU1646233.1 drug exporter of the superfamily [Nocardia sp.]
MRKRRWLIPALLLIVFTVGGGWFSATGGKLGDVVKSGAATYLPKSSEASTAAALDQRFGEAQTLPALVVYTRPGGLTVADRTAIGHQIDRINTELADKLAGPVQPPADSDDKLAAEVIVPYAGTDETKIAGYVPELRDIVHDPSGPPASVTGPAGVQADLQNALGAIDGLLVLVTAAVILLILVLVYRSPLLPFLVLAVAGLALTAAQGVIYLLVKHGVLSLGSEVQGILNVLILGAGTDYALLIVSRYREELRAHDNRFDAMRAAWRRSLLPVFASGGTVILGLLCLLVSGLGLNRDLGPAGAIGIGCALLAMTTVLPLALALLGRAAFWPRRPTYEGASDGYVEVSQATGTAAAAPRLRGATQVLDTPAVATEADRSGRWARIAVLVARHPRPLWMGALAVLALLSLGLLRLHADGIPQTDMILEGPVESATGQTALAAHYSAGSGNPVLTIAHADRIPQVADVIRAVPGVATTDISPTTVDGLGKIDTTLTTAPDSKASLATVERLRSAVAAAVPDAQSKTGGYTAVLIDFNAQATKDRIVIPLLLLVICVLLTILLRSVVASLLLLATVVLSYLAALGVSAVMFHDVFGFSGVDATYPLHAFVFLVALGVDYNIFLMTRVREEAQRTDTRRGTIAGLTVTGGVITSAGIVLAATFAALAVIPLVLLVELAFTVAFGVLLDTFVVRSILVPALTIDLGRAMWWPSALSRRTIEAGPVPESEPERTESETADR